MLIYTIFNKKLLKPKARLIEGRCFKKFNDEEFNKDLQLVPFHPTYVFEDIDDIYWAWEELYKNVLDDRASIKCRKVRDSFRRSKFITPEIHTISHRKFRNAMERKYNKPRTPDNWEAYRITCNRIVTVRRRSVVNHFEHLCISSAGKPKELWNSLRPLMHSKRCAPSEYITLKGNNKIIKDKNHRY